jgi:hypothetical protein
MKYLLLNTWHGCGYSSVGCSQSWEFRDFDGTLEEAKEHFMNRALYGDDRAEDFNKLAKEDTPKDVIIVPYETAHVLDVELAIAEQHERIDAEEAKKQAGNELKEFERLKKKLGK